MSPLAGPFARASRQPTALGHGVSAPLTPTKDGPPYVRLSARRRAAIAGQLSERDHEVLAAVARFRVMSGCQLARLFWPSPSPQTQGRLSRRGLARLTRLGVVEPLARQVGGAGGGSAGSIFALGRVGQYLLQPGRRVRRPRTPGERYLAHALTVAGLYVDLMEAQRAGKLELTCFAPEPRCWRPYLGAYGARLVLKPDAYVTLAAGDYEYSWFIECDRATEAQTTIAAKARRYYDYFSSGVEQSGGGVFPRTAWLVPDQAHAERVAATLGSLPAETWRLFVVAPAAEAVTLLSSEAKA